MYSIYDHLGQFSFRIPAAPLYPAQPFLPAVNDVLREQGRVSVRVQTQNRVLFEGVVPQNRLDTAIQFLTVGRRFLPIDESPITQYVAITATGGRSVWSGTLTNAQIAQVISIIRDGRFIYVDEPLPSVRSRFASVRSRGGFATLFGVAAGYALGGPVGAAVGGFVGSRF